MKQLLSFCFLLLLLSNCARTTTSASSPEYRIYKNRYNSYLEKGEKKMDSWYQGITSKKDDDKYIVRLFYPEKNQITSLITYKIYDKDSKHGLYKTWSDRGHLTAEGMYEDNYREGPWKFYSNRDGHISSEGVYEDGEQQGIWKDYDFKGRLSNEITWKYGVKEGAFTEYDSLGNTINEGIYQADTIFQQTKVEKEKRVYANGAIFTLVEEMPYLKEFEHMEDIMERKKTSDNRLLKYIYENIKYPSVARRNNVEGLALFTFIVMEDGSITDIHTISGICESIEKECRRIINNMPPWNPGRQDGKAIRVIYQLPIRFKLT